MSVISVFAAVLPGSAGAVPSTARLPFTAPCQVVPSVLVVWVRDEQVPPLDGSPITRAAYPSNWDADIACHVDGVAWVTVYPAFCSTVVSGAVVSPFWSSTSTAWPVAALAAGAAATLAAAATAATPAAAATGAATGITAVPAASTGPSPAATSERARRTTRRVRARVRATSRPRPVPVIRAAFTRTPRSVISGDPFRARAGAAIRLRTAAPAIRQ